MMIINDEIMKIKQKSPNLCFQNVCTAIQGKNINNSLFTFSSQILQYNFYVNKAIKVRVVESVPKTWDFSDELDIVFVMKQRNT